MSDKYFQLLNIGLIVLIIYIFSRLFPKKSNRNKIKSNNSYDYNRKNYYKDDGFYPYSKKKFLFSIPERHFFEILNEIFKDTEYSVFPKVRLWDILEIQSNYKTYYTYQNKIRSKHIDYVICKGIYFQPVLVIELDGKHHWTDANTIYNDKIKNNIFEATKLPIIRVQAKASKSDYNITQLKNKIFNKIDDI